MAASSLVHLWYPVDERGKNQKTRYIGIQLPTYRKPTKFQGWGEE